MGVRSVETGLSSTVSVTTSSSTVKEYNDEFDLHVIEGLGEEMMQLIVEAATLRLKPRITFEMAAAGYKE